MDATDAGGARGVLNALYDAAVERAHPAFCLPPWLPDVGPRERLLVIGAGKAGAAMAQATEAHYASLPPGRVSGFVTTRHGSALACQRLDVVEAAHPVPDASSVAAATRALEMAAGADTGTLVLVLLSGGASALWAAPASGIALAAKQELTRQLLRCGARISEINTVRRHLSRIKGGKLAAAAHPARLVTLAISDVPGDDPAAIGSGPTVADPTSLADARAVIARYGLAPDRAIVEALSDPANETLKPDDPRLASARYAIVAAPAASLEAAARAAAAMGYRPLLLGDALEGEAREVARVHADLARAALARRDRVAILSGGELTVTVKGNGIGGPNQEYALSLAIALEGVSGVSALAADTDGIDGGSGQPDDPAGAVVMPDTLVRARALDLNPANFLANNNATAFFSALGDLVCRGPTQTNVNDFRAVLVAPPD